MDIQPAIRISVTVCSKAVVFNIVDQQRRDVSGVIPCNNNILIRGYFTGSFSICQRRDNQKGEEEGDSHSDWF